MLYRQLYFIVKRKMRWKKYLCAKPVEIVLFEPCLFAVNPWPRGLQIRQADHCLNKGRRYKVKSLGTYTRPLWRERAGSGRVCPQSHNRQFPCSLDNAQRGHQDWTPMALTHVGLYKVTRGQSEKQRIYFSPFLVPVVWSMAIATQALGATTNYTKLAGQACWLTAGIVCWQELILSEETGWPASTACDLHSFPFPPFLLFCLRGKAYRKAKPLYPVLLIAKSDGVKLTSSFKYLPPYR